MRENFESMVNYMVVRGYSVLIQAMDPIEVLNGTHVKIGTPIGVKEYRAHTPLECMQLAYDEISNGIGKTVSAESEAQRLLDKMAKDPNFKGCGSRR